LRRLVRAVVVLAAVALVYDAARPPARQASARFAVAAIHGYQRTLSPLVAGGGVACRFTPTCSRYAEAVITRHGMLRGGWLTIKRIMRCGPWTSAGTKDPP
jgi:hypothetical protein